MASEELGEVLLWLIGFCWWRRLRASVCLLTGDTFRETSTDMMLSWMRNAANAFFVLFCLVRVLLLPLSGVFSAMSNTTRRPSRLEMGRPRSKGSNSPLCITQTYHSFTSSQTELNTYRLLQAGLQALTMRATRSERCRPYLATTGLRTSVTGLVGFAFRPTDRLMGTRSSLDKEDRVQLSCGTQCQN